MPPIFLTYAVLQVQCKHEKNIPFRLNRPYPDPPTLEQWKAPPRPGTEKILREAFRKKRQELPEADHLLRKKVKHIPWVLEMDFKSDEDLWLFIDDMDLAELRRQRMKFGISNFQEEEQLKKGLFLLVKHQEFYRREADELMERRIIRANRRAEYRERNRLYRAQKKAKSTAAEIMDSSVVDPFEEDTNLSWITPRDVEPLREIPFSTDDLQAQK